MASNHAGWHRLLPVAFFLPVIFAAQSAAPARDTLDIAVFENLEGYHVQASQLGTELGSVMMDIWADVRVDDSVPLRSNESIRILEGMTAGRKVVITTITALARGGGIDYPSIEFADDSVKFSDLTWKVDEEAVLSRAADRGATYCLVGTCTGLVTSPAKGTAMKRHDISTVTAMVNLRLFKVTTRTAVWMETYRKVIAHPDPRLALAQAIEELAPVIGSDIRATVETSSGK